MSSGSMAAYRAAAPPEMFGEPDYDEPRCTQLKCRHCGAFVSWKGAVTERSESYFGEIVETTAWPCKRCGADGFSVEGVVGKVYGPLPPWSDPEMVWNAELDVWEDYMAQDCREMMEDEACAACFGAAPPMPGLAGREEELTALERSRVDLFGAP